ncbi:MAG: sigma-54-dependent transcriptional regulator [Desulfobulbus sp.]|jgi:two-component system response regulator AtoC
MRSLLIIDDEANMRHMLGALLGKHGYAADMAANGEEGLALFVQRPYDFVLCDLKMPVMDGMAFLARARTIRESTIIMMSAYGSMDQALETMKQGAYDYISKPFRADEILLVLGKAEERERLRSENRVLRAQVEAMDREVAFGGMVGESRAMQAVFQLAEKIAPHDATVLITGESGTGKELVARGIHRAGKGEAAPFVAVNCGGIPEQLLESEFFGHVRGAFTGADRDKPGLFEAADGGTLFLDEIGELPPGLQVKLLRVLQEPEIRRVGAVRGKKVAVRVLAATNRDLEQLVAAGLFRADLLYRLSVLHIHVPPLRERPGDIPVLCRFLLTKLAMRLDQKPREISPAAMDLLLRHSWPGNVRELENTLERALILCDRGEILPEHLPPHLAARPERRRMTDILGTYSLKEGKVIMETRMIRRALEAAGGNKTRASQLLELSYPALLAKLKRYGLEEEGKSTAHTHTDSTPP